MVKNSPKNLDQIFEIKFSQSIANTNQLSNFFLSKKMPGLLPAKREKHLNALPTYSITTFALVFVTSNYSKP